MRRAKNSDDFTGGNSFEGENLESASPPINGNTETANISIFFILFSPFHLLKNIQ
jgi:hypothetical protein